ncbi:Ribosomal protein L24e-related [Macleaya cordata]|uniref:Ribosomal protein L24e-related n=1 Tax=Macleaya cordata TaxID=56857 RepID=A0A200PQT5_MACCD|nr:Ribosomal protein L24e-related [Macleaya cordata]
MRLEKCWFCSSTIYPGHGIQFARNDAKEAEKELNQIIHIVRVPQAEPFTLPKIKVKVSQQQIEENRPMEE